jgi:hypothetical protein
METPTSLQTFVKHIICRLCQSLNEAHVPRITPKKDEPYRLGPVLNVKNVKDHFSELCSFSERKV